jgi:imidazolonepropionase-like amidohydrolase
MTTTLIRNARLLDVEQGLYVEGASVAIERGEIAEVSEREIAFKAERVIDARGLTLMPGLIDAHVHAYLTTMDLAALSLKPASLLAHEGAEILEGMLQRGFTSVRDAAGADWGLQTAVERDLVKGPRLYISGRALSQTGGHGDPRARGSAIGICSCGAHTSWLAHVVDGVPAVLAAARAELRGGANQIKIMASGGVASPADPLMSIQFTLEEIRAAAGEARDWGTYAMAHAYSPEAITRAIEGGVRTIEHGNFLDEATARLMVERSAFLVPTLVTYHTLYELGRQAGFPEANLAKTAQVLQAGLRSLEIAREAGLPTGYGTDLLGMAHPQQNREFEIRAEVLTPLELIRSATLVNARILNEEGRLGTIGAGAHADLLLVEGDPLRDISVLVRTEETLRLVMKAGRIYRNAL